MRAIGAGLSIFLDFRNELAEKGVVAPHSEKRMV